MTIQTKNFHPREFRQPERYGFDSVEYPEKWLKRRWLRLAEMLEWIRWKSGGRPIRIVSGYRSPAYNSRVGGVDRSYHTRGMAADLQHTTLSASELHRIILDARTAGYLGDLGGLGVYDSFVHVDTRRGWRLAKWDGRTK